MAIIKIRELGHFKSIFCQADFAFGPESGLIGTVGQFVNENKSN